MSWHKDNLYNLVTKSKPKDFTKLSVFQQKWLAKREARGYHGQHIPEHQFIARHFRIKLPLQHFSPAKREQVPPMQALAFGDLERRLDVTIFRCHFASDVVKAKKQVLNGHVLVNGKLVNISL